MSDHIKRLLLLDFTQLRETCKLRPAVRVSRDYRHTTCLSQNTMLDQGAGNAINATNEAANQQESGSVLEKVALQSPLIEEMKQSSTFTSSRSVLHIDQEHISNNLTASTLLGEGMISEPPYVFADDTSGSIVAFYHLGRRLAGHAGIVHGGMLAVLLDECMGRACFPRLEAKIAVTAKMEIAYKSPMKVDSVISVRARTTDVQGRKACVEADVEDATEGRTIATAFALFIQPRWAKEMSACMP